MAALSTSTVAPCCSVKGAAIVIVSRAARNSLRCCPVGGAKIGAMAVVSKRRGVVTCAAAPTAESSTGM